MKLSFSAEDEKFREEVCFGPECYGDFDADGDGD